MGLKKDCYFAFKCIVICNFILNFYVITTNALYETYVKDGKGKWCLIHSCAGGILLSLKQKLSSVMCMLSKIVSKVSGTDSIIQAVFLVDS